ncbi:MAG: hypothetical protein JWM80_765 [Cyanobacteria bacterium RYN_339]|nr:hypothetical protein [Cyanobacteria bacterium RYN_339]
MSFQTRCAWLLAAPLLGLGWAGGAVAQDAESVAVTFKEPVGTRFVDVINTVMGTTTVKKQDETHYTFHVGPGGNQNDFALFFAHLPYVKAVAPAPKLSGAEQKAPDVIVRIGPKPGYVPGQLLVKFKPGVTKAQIDAFNQGLGSSTKEQIEGIDVWLLQLPASLSVDEARKRYGASDLVAYAEPNRVMSLPRTEPDVYLSPDRLLGDHVLVRFRTGGPTMDLVNQVYGTRTIEEAGQDRYRVSLPAGTNALVAQHVFRICPFVMQVEPSYGR